MEKEVTKVDGTQMAQLGAEILVAFGIEDPYGWWGSVAAFGAAIRQRIVSAGTLHGFVRQRLSTLLAANPYFTAPSMCVILIRMAALELIDQRGQTEAH